jgi:light-regulated signal transduction histidine kinase (bacteriophytochrome)
MARILVVEDDTDIAELIRHYLQKAGHQVDWLASGRVVLAHVRHEVDQDLPRVFERFYRVDKARSRGERDPGGTGLGLALVKHLVELHGGRVTAANRPGGGALFTIDLPAQ